MKYNIDSFKRGLAELNIELPESSYEQFILFYDMLIEKNKVMNLTGITEWEDVVTKHFLDSLSLVKYFENMTDVSYSIIDVGTGAGFPGIPLKIAFPNLNVTLLDTLNKRVLFLQSVIDELGLKNIQAVHARAEDLAFNKEYREGFDIAVSRAVANLSVLNEYCLPFVKQNGYFISYKACDVNSEEIISGQNSIKVLGGSLDKDISFELPYTDMHRLLYGIKKIKPTPKMYPRKPAVIKKEPL